MQPPPKHWARATDTATNPEGETLELTAWGWSDESPSGAESVARTRLSRIIDRVRSGLGLSRDYPYGRTPLREPLLARIESRDGELIAVVTRNSIGCAVLNTAGVVFIDIDLPRPPGLLKRLFSKQPEVTPESKLDEIRHILNAHGGRWRVYRTAAGFRLLRADETMAPDGDEVQNLMTEIGADPRFIQLCRAQESFRARLTPKPFRCRAPRPPARRPVGPDVDHDEYQQWVQQYDQACSGYAACRFLEETGRSPIDPVADQIIRLHDERTLAHEDLPLA